jgi:hypothetical protein
MVLATENTLFNADSARSNIKDKSKAFVFLGTPHFGSNLTFIAKITALFGYWAGSNTDLLDLMDRGSNANHEINERFASYYKDRDIVNFYSAFPDSMLGYPFSVVSQ